MKIVVVGTGYVGLVTGTCFAEKGNQVICVDNDAGKVALLQQGGIPIFEPGLTELVRKNVQLGRLQFSTNLAASIQSSSHSSSSAELIFIAVGTPQADDGSANLTYLLRVGEELATAIKSHGKIVVIKSTVPMGTNRQLSELLARDCPYQVDVVSNPEFLREGVAVSDCLEPDRVVVGVRRPEVGEVMRRLYETFVKSDRFISMSPESAEMTKYAANAMLATKISFINEMANVCEAFGADINEVRQGIGLDKRIGFQFLMPGVGYGGSCFPKDISALIWLERSKGLHPRMMEAVQDTNKAQKQVLFQKIRTYYGESLSTKTLAIWGLAFKPETDDIRDAPSLVLIEQLLSQGVNLRVYDPQAMENVRKEPFGDRLTYCSSPQEAATGAHGVVIVTEWAVFRQIDRLALLDALREAVIFDGRNLFDPQTLRAEGFVYQSIGRS